MTVVRDLELVDVSVTTEATFADAARVLSESGVQALAVVEAGKVVGVFTQDTQLRGLFPEYLGELRHTAFVDDDREGLAERARTVQSDPVTRHTADAPCLEGGDSQTHAAELFLHCGLGALPVMDGGRFCGMLEQRTLCDAAIDRLGR